MPASDIIPIDLDSNDGSISKITSSQADISIHSVSGSQSNTRITEKVLEEFVRKNTSRVFGENETLLIVGQQVQNDQGGRADLVAVDGDGNIVLIELKRDREALAGRREAFEFQAVRYAANYASIDTPQDLVQILYAPYIDRHKDEYDLKQLTSIELATRLLDEFLTQNQAERTFNQRQRIVLISSGYDLQTLSACAWLAKGGIDIQCINVTLISHQSQYFFFIEQIIPPQTLEDFFIGITKPDGTTVKTARRTPGNKEWLPRLPEMFKWKLVEQGDQLYIKNHSNESATVIDQKSVSYNGTTLSYLNWGKKVTGWSGINIYERTVQTKTGKTLDDLRKEKMKESDSGAEDDQADEEQE